MKTSSLALLAFLVSAANGQLIKNTFNKAAEEVVAKRTRRADVVAKWSIHVRRTAVDLTYMLEDENTDAVWIAQGEDPDALEVRGADKPPKKMRCFGSSCKKDEDEEDEDEEDENENENSKSDKSKKGSRKLQALGEVEARPTDTPAADEEDVTMLRFTNTAEVDERVDTRSSSTTTAGSAEPYNGKARDATGKLYFEQWDEASNKWFPYYCSASTIHDNETGRSLILTAAHCIFDSFTDKFHRNPLFIPNENANSEYDTNCEDDPCGCWVPTGGVVHDLWDTAGAFPKNHEYDVGFYVVEDSALSHEGAQCRGSTTLDMAIDELFMDVTDELVGDTVTGVGYHSSEENVASGMVMESCTNTIESVALSGKPSLLIPDCGLGSGASGGPWLHQDKVVGVNSWGYKNKPGMGGPILNASPTRCLVNKARLAELSELTDAEGNAAGTFASCYDRPCVEDSVQGGRRLRANPHFHKVECHEKK